MAKVSLYDGHGFVELVDMMGDQHRVIEAARVSYGARTKGKEKDRKLFHYLMRHQHHGPLEHVVMTFRVRAPIYVARQHMRHRTWSYNELSRRYSTSKPDVYLPFDTDPEFLSYAKGVVDKALQTYEHGVSFAGPERARDVLPMATMTEYIATVDLRNFLHFHELRFSSHAQKEIRDLAGTMYDLVMRQPNMEWVHEAYNLYGMGGLTELRASVYSSGLLDEDSIRHYLKRTTDLPDYIIDAIVDEL